MFGSIPSLEVRAMQPVFNVVMVCINRGLSQAKPEGPKPEVQRAKSDGYDSWAAHPSLQLGSLGGCKLPQQSPGHSPQNK